MHVLIVLAHPEPKSFNATLAAVAEQTLTAAGHEVRISDLYRDGFKAVADAADFTGAHEDPDFFRLDREQTQAHRTNSLAADIVAEQDKISWADLIILQFPMWWFGPPAILKGWADRVFTRGFAYFRGHKYDTGLLAGKTALVSVTTGTSADTYRADGIDGAMLDVLWPVHNGLLRYSGLEVIEPFVSYAPRRLDAELRDQLLDQWRAKLSNLDEAPRLFFHPLSDYGPDERLRPGVAARSGFQHNIPGSPAEA